MHAASQSLGVACKLFVGVQTPPAARCPEPHLVPAGLERVSALSVTYVTLLGGASDDPSTVLSAFRDAPEPEPEGRSQRESLSFSLILPIRDCLAQTGRGTYMRCCPQRLDFSHKAESSCAVSDAPRSLPSCAESSAPTGGQGAAAPV